MEEIIERRERLAVKKQGEVGETLKRYIYGGLSEGTGMKPYLHGRIDLAKNVKLRFRGGEPGPARKKKEVYQQPGGEGSRCTDHIGMC